MDIIQNQRSQKGISPSNQTTPASLENIPFSFARRIFMITEKDSLKEIKLKELETLLLEHHYPEIIIKTGINKALRILQNELRIVKEQEKKKILRFILAFNPNNPKTLPIIKQLKKLKKLKKLKNLDRTRNALKKVKFINGKRQAPNLGRILCTRVLFHPVNSNSGAKNCGKSFVCCQ